MSSFLLESVDFLSNHIVKPFFSGNRGSPFFKWRIILTVVGIDNLDFKITFTLSKVISVFVSVSSFIHIKNLNTSMNSQNPFVVLWVIYINLSFFFRKSVICFVPILVVFYRFFYGSNGIRCQFRCIAFLSY